MEDLERYLNEIVDPTIADFEKHPSSVRHAFLACVATYHAVDYLAHPKRSAGNLAKTWRDQSRAFRIVDHVAHAFKHVTSERSNQTLRAKEVLNASEVISVPGAFGPEFSDGFQVAKVTLESDPTGNILRSLQEAAKFLRQELVREN